MIEGALVGFAFTLAIIFVLEFGRSMLFIGDFTERARAGARHASVVNYKADTIKNYVTHNSATPPTGGNGLFGLKPEMIAVARYDEGKETDRLTVSINNYPLSLFVPLLPAQWTLRPFKITIPAESMGHNHVSTVPDGKFSGLLCSLFWEESECPEKQRADSS
ncbi:MAG: hypothetical protein FJW38_16740 [Acidobacteria bacterium]|nr:hypothetical protein [Acidobacteriota bacterium]